MKTILLAILATTTTNVKAFSPEQKLMAAYKADRTEAQLVYNQILVNRPKIKVLYAQALANEIHKQSKNYKISPKIISAILAVESMYDHTKVNKHSGDYGLSQINYKTIKAYKLDKARLSNDIAYSIKSGALVLSYFHKRYAHKEKHWYARYNVGTREGAIKSKTAKNYIKLVSKYL